MRQLDLKSLNRRDSDATRRSGRRGEAGASDAASGRQSCRAIETCTAARHSRRRGEADASDAASGRQSCRVIVTCTAADATATRPTTSIGMIVISWKVFATYC